MSETLANSIKDKIQKDGAMSIADYMGMCLGHHTHGYYMTRDPLGVKGDFITAPEVSQMFGEMIGLWLVDVWIKMGSPPDFILLECGPGRGTLMADILRTTKNVAGFHAAMRVYLMEISPVLMAAQKQALGGYSPIWVADLKDVSSDVPVLLVANEFLDALPIHQFVRRDGAWFEKFVDLNENDAFQMVEKPVNELLINLIPPILSDGSEDGVFEASSILNQYIKNLSIRIKKQRGVALFVDYGHAQSSMGETLQVMQSHRFANLFDTPGLCDITAHVDFENVAMQAWSESIIVHGATTQRDFLLGLGIEVRADRLKSNATGAQSADIETGLHRLIDTAQMGNLFKVMALCDDPNLKLEGFDESL